MRAHKHTDVTVVTEKRQLLVTKDLLILLKKKDEHFLLVLNIRKQSMIDHQYQELCAANDKINDSSDRMNSLLFFYLEVKDYWTF